MPSVPAPLPDTLPWRVFTRAEALRAGVSAERLRRSDLTRLRPGLLARRGCEPTEADIASAICRNEADAVVMGPSAARMQGIPLPQEESARAGTLCTSRAPAGAAARMTWCAGAVPC